MKCRYCNVALAPLRTLTDGEFCCDEHRVAFAELGGNEAASPPPESGLVPLGAKFETVAGETPALQLKQPVPLEFRPKTMAAPAFAAPVESRETKKWFGLPQRLLSLKFSTQLFNMASKRVTPPMAEPQFPAKPMLPGAQVEPTTFVRPAKLSGVDSEVPKDAIEDLVESEPRFQRVALEAARCRRWMADVWTKAPSELKIMTVLLPVLLAMAVSHSMPKVQIPAAATSGVQQMVADRWSTLNKSILNRAAIAYTDDFRSGLDGWESRSNLTTRWSYDASGFVQPGPLAVFRPT